MTVKAALMDLYWGIRMHIRPNDETLEAIEEAEADRRGEIELPEWEPPSGILSKNAERGLK